jgi:chromosome transmission fidelity protein 18
MAASSLIVVPSSPSKPTALEELHSTTFIEQKSSEPDRVSQLEEETVLEVAPTHLPLPELPSEGSEPDMTFSSSPVLYPPSSSPAPAPVKKRRLFQTLTSDPPAKRPKVLGGFIQDDEEADKTPAADKDSIPFSQLAASIGKDDEVVATPDGGRESRPYTDLPLLSPPLPLVPRLLRRKLATKGLIVQTSAGETLQLPKRVQTKAETYEHIIAQRSTVAPGRAKKAYYGIDIHHLVHEAGLQCQLDEAQAEFLKQQADHQTEPQPPVSRDSESGKKDTHQLWTEKYRAKKFTDLVGDERTHRLVLKWLKAWDDVVFPGTRKSKPKRVFGDRQQDPERQHRKILLLTSPPGLGKTTLAHVCAKQAGYEALEINASDDRSKDVVKGRIKDALGTETVRGIREAGKERKAGRPVCVIVDEVDGVVTGSGGSGDGGFIKALIDLVQLDQRNSTSSVNNTTKMATKKKGDSFRMLRPLILICNDIYVPSLRPLRTSSLAEIVHVRKPGLDKLITRMKNVFEAEKIPCDNEAVRRICESSWGMGTRKQNSAGGRGAGEGDIRGILVQAEWIANKFRAHAASEQRPRLDRKWVEMHLADSQASRNQNGLGRSGIREVVDRIFVEGAGLPNLPTSLSADDARQLAEAKTTSIGVSDLRKRAAFASLREMVDTFGEHDRVMTECFAAYPTQNYQDDVNMSKPNEAYEWLSFHDALSSRVYSHQEWELSPYLNTGVCGFHHLFASVDKGDKNWHEDKKEEEDQDTHPFSGPRADFAAHEAEKQNKAVLTELQSSFSAPLLRLFSSMDTVAIDLIPNVQKMLAPDVKPIIVGGSSGNVASVRKESEKKCIDNAVRAMRALEVRFEKVKVEADSAHGRGGFVYRMEP